MHATDMIQCISLFCFHYSQTHILTYIHKHTSKESDDDKQSAFFFFLFKAVYVLSNALGFHPLPSLPLPLLHSVCLSLHCLLHLCSVTSVQKNFALMAFRLHSRYFLWFTLFVCFLIVVNNNEMSLFCSHKRYKDGAQGRIRLTLPNVNTTKNKKGQQCKHFTMTGMELVKGQPRPTMARVRSGRARAGCWRCFLLSQALSHSRKGQQPERRGLIFLSIVFFSLY